MSDHHEDVKKQVEAEFRAMEQALAALNPGVLDVIQVYGDYEMAIRQAEDYLSASNPRPTFYTTDQSS